MMNEAVRPPWRVFATWLHRGIVMFVLGAGNASAADEIEFNLDQARWTDRILVIAADSAQQQDLLAMTRQADAHACEFSNRDLRLLVIIAASTMLLDGQAVEAQSAARMIARLAPADTPFALLLIGKDGAIKQRWRSAVPVREIFALIDGMPMRRGESDGDRDCR